MWSIFWKMRLHILIYENIFNCQTYRRLSKSLKTCQTNIVTQIESIRRYEAAFEITGNRYLDLISSSMQYGNVPKKLKMSTVDQVEKKENAINSEEFRTINTLPAYGKLLNLGVKYQLVTFLDSNSSKQDFVQPNSCETALQKVLEE